jgi:hypothetical protein
MRGRNGAGSLFEPELRRRSNHFKSGPYGAFGIILMGLGVTEIREEAIGSGFGQETAKTLDRAHHGAMAVEVATLA